jgi:rare lipoprotein A
MTGGRLFRRLTQSPHQWRPKRGQICNCHTCSAFGCPARRWHQRSLEPDAEAGLFRQGFVYSYSSGKTASGESFDRDQLTAAHRTLPFGTRVRVTELRTGRSVIVRITDRGPAIGSRVLDLSMAAARSLGITDRGVTEIRAEVL